MRNNLGYTVNYADKMDLLKMTPQLLFRQVSAWLIMWALEPSTWSPPNGESFAVNLSVTTRVLNVEWFDPSTGATASGGTVPGGSTITFTSPFSADAVLHLVDAAGHN